MVNNPLAKLWVGRCNIYEYQEKIDPDTFQSKGELVQVVSEEPCRLSQTHVAHNFSELVSIDKGAPYIEQLIVMFIRPDLDIKAGSIIEITQHGRTEKYKRSSKPAVYTNHQEIVLELFEDHA